MWSCTGAQSNSITESTFGLCDKSQGCQRVCGDADHPISRYSRAAVQLTNAGVRNL